MSQLQFYFGLGLVAVGVVLAGYTWILREQIEDLQVEIRTVENERDAARALTKRLYHSIDQLALDQAASDNRWRQVQTGREAVIAVPEGEDGPVANTLLKALQAADRIGGHE